MADIYQLLIKPGGWLAIAWLVLTLLAGCDNSAQKLAVVRQAVAVESTEECHLCGMVISKFPGPKGQLYQRGQQQNRKFCSTRDMFAYLLDPEHRHQIQEAYVHNMAASPWDKPGENTYVDAKTAWYVVGHRLPGAMGPTLATFKEQSHAEIFAEEFGGKLYVFEQLTIELISSMSQVADESTLRAHHGVDERGEHGSHY